MIAKKTKRGAVGLVEDVRAKLQTHIACAKGRPVNESTLRLLPSVEQCEMLSDWLGAALAELRGASDERKDRVRLQRLARLRKVVGAVLTAVRESKDGWVMKDDDASEDFHVGITLTVREVRELMCATRWLAQPSVRLSDSRP